MADIYSTVQVLIQVLTPLITAEATLISGLGDDVKAIRNQLQEIAGFLIDAEVKAEGNDGDKAWVRRVRLLAYEIDDAIERFQLYKKETYFGKAKQVVTLELRGIASTIKDLRQRVVEVGTRKFYLTPNNNNNTDQRSGSSSKHTQTTSYHLCINGNTELVGTETPKREIIELLGLQELGSGLSTVAVVGMRGLGKTTLAGSIYNDSEVKGNFPIRAWITVSAISRKHEDILRSMMQQFCVAAQDHKIYNNLNNDMSEVNIIKRIDSMDKRSLLPLVQKYLNEKRYLIVFDDIRETDMEFATYMKRLLPTDNEGSKILVTTRYENVAHNWLDGSFKGLYKLNPLSKEKAWSLFCKKAFKSSCGRCPSSLHELAQEVVRKCGGLPPAILAIGRLLSRKPNDLHGWERVYSSLGFYLQRNSQLSEIYRDLMQNYHDLPHHLKPCFLYFGLFHKGYPIDRMRLIRLWIAEGFIVESGGDITLEDIAEEYMNELINMNLVQVRSRDPTGRPRTLGIANEFLHEIILLKLDELSFCQIHTNRDSVGSEMTRRLSIHRNHYINAHTVSKSKNIRSLFLMDPAQDLDPRELNREFFKNVRLLRVLDLCNTAIGSIPDEVGKLLNLQYLSLRNTLVETLPSSIGKLHSLQTLDLKQTSIRKLPKEIDQLHKLRHLLSYSYEYDFSVSALTFKIMGVAIPAVALERCSELQKLVFLDVGVGNENLMIQLKNLRQLRKLGIVGLKSEHGKDLCSAIEEMKHLQTFIVFSKIPRETLDLQSMKSPPRLLKRLSLNGHLMSFPTWILQLPSISKVHLKWSNLHDDPLAKLEVLPNLVELLLLEAYSGEKLKIQNAGFQKLKILHLLDLHGLMSLSISKGALPLLQELSIGESRKLAIPSGIKYLTNLKTLRFYNMPLSFSDSLQPGEQNYPIVKHVPDVVFYSKHSQGYWQMSTLT